MCQRHSTYIVLFSLNTDRKIRTKMHHSPLCKNMLLKIVAVTEIIPRCFFLVKIFNNPSSNMA